MPKIVQTEPDRRGVVLAGMFNINIYQTSTSITQKAVSIACRDDATASVFLECRKQQKVRRKFWCYQFPPTFKSRLNREVRSHYLGNFKTLIFFKDVKKLWLSKTSIFRQNRKMLKSKIHFFSEKIWQAEEKLSTFTDELYSCRRLLWTIKNFQTI